MKTKKRQEKTEGQTAYGKTSGFDRAIQSGSGEIPMLEAEYLKELSAARAPCGRIGEFHDLALTLVRILTKGDHARFASKLGTDLWVAANVDPLQPCAPSALGFD